MVRLIVLPASSVTSGDWFSDCYISNVSIIFDCFMLYYILFGCLMGSIIHFYIIFGTFILYTFLFKGKPTRCSRGIKKDFRCRCRGGLRQVKSRFDPPLTCQFLASLPGRSTPSQDIPSTHHKLSSLALHYSPFACHFPLPHF